MKGFYNMVLKVDATQRSFELIRVPDEVLRQTLGGKGLATRLLLQHNPAGADPLGPENHLIFASVRLQTPASGGLAATGSTPNPPRPAFTPNPIPAAPRPNPCRHRLRCGDDPRRGARAGVAGNQRRGRNLSPGRRPLGLETYETEDRVKQWLKENRPEAGRSGVVVIGPAGETKWCSR